MANLLETYNNYKGILDETWSTMPTEDTEENVEEDLNYNFSLEKKIKDAGGILSLFPNTLKRYICLSFSDANFPDDSWLDKNIPKELEDNSYAFLIKVYYIGNQTDTVVAGTLEFDDTIKEVLVNFYSLRRPKYQRKKIGGEFTLDILNSGENNIWASPRTYVKLSELSEDDQAWIKRRVEKVENWNKEKTY